VSPRARSAAACALAAALALAAGARADEPPCIAQCRDLAAKKQLRDGLNEQGCQVNICQMDGRNLYKEGKYKEALDTYAVIADRLQTSPSFRFDRGLVYYSLGRFDEALLDFNVIVTESPDSFPAGAQRAHTLVRLGKLKDAREEFDKLLASPAAEREFRGLRTKSYLTGNIGVIDVVNGDVSKGKQELEDALQQDGRNTLASTYIYRVLPQVDKKTIDGPGILLLLGASEDVGIANRDAARDAIEKLVQKYPKFPETYFLAAELYRGTGHFDECERLLLIGEKAIPDEVDLKAERIRCTLLKVGPTSPEAKEPITELKQLSFDHPDASLPKKILRALDIY